MFITYICFSNGTVIIGPIGFVADPWRINATMVTDQKRNTVTLSGDLECVFDALGNCTFDNLIMNGVTANVQLGFDVAYGM